METSEQRMKTMFVRHDLGLGIVTWDESEVFVKYLAIMSIHRLKCF